MSTEPRIYPDPEIDRGTKWVRGIFGALLGLAVAACIWVKSGGLSLWPSIALAVCSIVVGSWGSVRHGDAFWYAVLRRGP
jgi:hypothetical protein